MLARVVYHKSPLVIFDDHQCENFRVHVTRFQKKQVSGAALATGKKDRPHAPERSCGLREEHKKLSPDRKGGGFVVKTPNATAKTLFPPAFSNTTIYGNTFTSRDLEFAALLGLNIEILKLLTTTDDDI